MEKLIKQVVRWDDGITLTDFEGDLTFELTINKEDGEYSMYLLAYDGNKLLNTIGFDFDDNQRQHLIDFLQTNEN